MHSAAKIAIATEHRVQQRQWFEVSQLRTKFFGGKLFRGFIVILN